MKITYANKNIYPELIFIFTSNTEYQYVWSCTLNEIDFFRDNWLSVNIQITRRNLDNKLLLYSVEFLGNHQKCLEQFLIEKLRCELIDKDLYMYWWEASNYLAIDKSYLSESFDDSCIKNIKILTASSDLICGMQLPNIYEYVNEIGNKIQYEEYDYEQWEKLPIQEKIIELRG